VPTLKASSGSGMVTQACNPNTREAEAGGPQVRGQAELHTERERERERERGASDIMHCAWHCAKNKQKEGASLEASVN
jgi:hypothetical protein